MNQRILETLTGDFAAVTPALLVVNYKQVRLTRWLRFEFSWNVACQVIRI